MNEELRIDLESRIAHQDKLLDELNQVIYQQQKAIDRLETTVSTLAKRYQEYMDTNSEAPRNEKPPHY